MPDYKARDKDCGRDETDYGHPAYIELAGFETMSGDKAGEHRCDERHCGDEQ
jgi:hypothetical protein